mmetsp:Transcript_26303/g.61805  ORF Transcript_26303/g.61805 Transcript_26303/m.61805 type:complete len:281 (+) Transcript_26303:845-1687(+)
MHGRRRSELRVGFRPLDQGHVRRRRLQSLPRHDREPGRHLRGPRQDLDRRRRGGTPPRFARPRGAGQHDLPLPAGPRDGHQVRAVRGRGPNSAVRALSRGASSRNDLRRPRVRRGHRRDDDGLRRDHPAVPDGREILEELRRRSRREGLLGRREVPLLRDPVRPRRAMRLLQVPRHRIVHRFQHLPSRKPLRPLEQRRRKPLQPLQLLRQVRAQPARQQGGKHGRQQRSAKEADRRPRLPHDGDRREPLPRLHGLRKRSADQTADGRADQNTDQETQERQ